MKAVAYWCLPREEDGGAYAEVIRVLACARGVPDFACHCTLATFTRPLDDVSDLLEALQCLTLSPVAVDGTDVFTTSLFIRLANTEQLMTARELSETLPGFRSGRTFDPHISLCYGPPPDLGKVHSKINALLARPVRFDRLAAVEITLPVETHADIARWRIAEVYSI